MNAGKAEPDRGLQHPFVPVVSEQSKALVLGSFPSVKSRENAFYYGHPQNRFWRVLAALFSEPTPATIAAKTAMLQKHHIALWDVVSSCTIVGSADSTLTAHETNDIATLMKGTRIQRIFANGQTAGKLYRKHTEGDTGVPIAILPSTSPANAAWSLERLIAAWAPLRDAADGTASRTADQM